MIEFTVSVSLVLSAPGLDLKSLGKLMDRATSTWNEGDFVSKRSDKKYSDTGVKFLLLNACEDYDWVEILEGVLQDLCDRIVEKRSELSLITPQLAFYVETNGSSFPPMFLSSSIIKNLAAIGAEIDIDILKILP